MARCKTTRCTCTGGFLAEKADAKSGGGRGRTTCRHARFMVHARLSIACNAPLALWCTMCGSTCDVHSLLFNKLPPPPGGGSCLLPRRQCRCFAHVRPHA
eukprot:366245-Chlamydomonas_euryale.AAC.22